MRPSMVLQWAAVVTNVWTIQTLGNLAVLVDHATVEPDSISTGDSFEFTYLTAR